MSIVSGTTSGILSADAQGEATDANRKNAKDTNAANILLNLFSRGGEITPAVARRFGLPKSVVGKSSAILPYYLNEIEATAGTSAAEMVKALQSISGTPEEQEQQYQAILQKYQPGFDANDALAQAIASGATTEQMLQEDQPVAASRLDVAQQKKNAGLEALKQTLSEIDAIQARKGYTGDSFGNRLLKFNARRAIGTQGAADIAGAKLENELEKRATLGQGRQLQISSIGLPDTLSRAAIDRKDIAGNNIARNFSRSLTPLQFFNIGPGAASQVQRFTEDANTSPWQVLSQAGSAIGNTAANYFLQKQLQKNAQNSYVNSVASNPSNWSTGSWSSPGAATAGGTAADIAIADIAPVSVAG